MTTKYTDAPRTRVMTPAALNNGVHENHSIGQTMAIAPKKGLFDDISIPQIIAGAAAAATSVALASKIGIAGSVIGADGFGFAPDEKGEFHKIPQIGNVRIEDDVEIGANTCIDRATMGSTVIHKGVKLDNLIQIGHNVTVGANTVAASQVGVAGSSKVGAGCMLGGQVGIAGHLTVGDGVKLASKSGISNSIPDGETYMGNPAMPGIKYHRSHAVFRNLPDLSYKVRQLEKELEKLKAQLSAE